MAESLRSPSDEVVSFESEQLILVDDQDRELGPSSKAQCHEGRGTLHRAFSLFVFNPAGELLIQRRSASKRLWPLFWSNSCCSHPRWGETMDEAVHRRLQQELRIGADLTYLFKFEYHAQFDAHGAEHELCWVYAGQSETEAVEVNGNEIDAWRFIAPDALDREMAQRPDAFTPWFKLEWKRIKQDHGEYLAPER